MDPTALQASWREVAVAGDEAAQHFYSHLFLSQPQVRGMFPISMATQRERFFAALGHIVSNVEQLTTDATFVEQLGRDHRRFDVAPALYPPVGASLLATLQHFLGERWTPQIAADWAEAYGVVAKIMIVAAEEAEETSPPWWDATVIATERRSLDIAVLQLRPNVPYPFQAGQSMSIEVPSRPRIWRYYSPANAPRADGSIELHVQIVAGGQVSAALARSVAPGDVVRLGAPIGHQLTIGDQEGDLLLVAGGTGLAPLRAVLEQVEERWHTTGAGPQVHLLHGARMPWNLYEAPYLAQLAEHHWFTYTPVVSDDPSYPGQRGFVGTAAADAAIQPGVNYTALVCGSAAMVTHTRGALAAAGLSTAAIRFEEFGVADGEPASTIDTLETSTW